MMWESVTHLTILERLNAQTPPRIVRDHFLLTSHAWAQLFLEDNKSRKQQTKGPRVLLLCVAQVQERLSFEL